MSIYEEKMPAYLAMSRGDLIAEILDAGAKVHTHLESTKGDDEAPEPPETEHERVRIANDVLRERFGITIHFHGDYDSGMSGGLASLLG